MADKSRIEWTDATWNPVTGCSKISPGCANCYAEGMSHRFGWTSKPWTEAHAIHNVTTHDDRLEIPLGWRQPRRVFVVSMGDLFHPHVPTEFLDNVFGTIAACAVHREHIFQVLTKRPDRMRAYFSDGLREALAEEASYAADGVKNHGRTRDAVLARPWPLPNLWLGVTAENQQMADERIPVLLDTPAAVRFVSNEPMLGPIDQTSYLHGVEDHDVDLTREPGSKVGGCVGYRPGLDWVICGGESGSKARPMHPAWARSLRDQCERYTVPFFFKQWGEWTSNVDRPREGDFWVPGDGSEILHYLEGDGYTGRYLDVWNHVQQDAVLMRRVGKKAAGSQLDGQVWDQVPEVADR